MGLWYVSLSHRTGALPGGETVKKRRICTPRPAQEDVPPRCMQSVWYLLLLSTTAAVCVLFQ